MAKDIVIDRFTNVAALEIESSVNVKILQSDAGVLSVEASGDRAESVKATFRNGLVSVSFGQASGGNVIIGDVVMGNVVMGSTIFGSGNVNIVSSGRSVQINNGQVIVDGVDVTGDRAPAAVEPTVITIYAPSGIDLSKCELSGIAKLASVPEFKTARLSVKGCSEVGIKARSLRARVSGSGSIVAAIVGGKFVARLSGSAQVRANGSFDDVDISVSGSGSVNTFGTVEGDYEADVSGVGRISHEGAVHGHISKSVSGIGSVSIG